jgi:hypothetical protein
LERVSGQADAATDAAEAAAGAVGAMAERLAVALADADRERACREIIDQALLDAITERDRLRTIVERAHDRVGVDEHVLRTLAVDDLVALVSVLRQDCRNAMIENDRLRAVVDAARAYVEAEVDDQADPEYHRERLVAALAALDASPTGDDA